MKSREQFVLRALDEAESFARLCRAFNVSRKTGYKWVARYKSFGVRGLEALSRRPNATPLATSADVVAEVVAIRNAHPTWGPRKIREVLRRDRVVEKVPGTRTIARVLERAGYIQPMRRAQRKRPPGAAPILVVAKPNDVWTVDFKGWWLTGGERCEPLTIRDQFSRFVLDVRVLSTTAGTAVRAAFEEVFKRYGLPRTILTDNGSPFASAQGSLGLTRLTVWWLSLGIDVQRTRPGTPSDNGGHERMHRDIKAELQRYAALTPRRQQAACDRWRHDFNNHRPHEALKMRVPADLFRKSSVPYDERPLEPNYPATFFQRGINTGGTISVDNKRLFISNALFRRKVGLEPLGADRYGIWFYARRLGIADFSSVPSFTAEAWAGAPSLASRAPARQTRRERKVA